MSSNINLSLLLTVAMVTALQSVATIEHLSVDSELNMDLCKDNASEIAGDAKLDSAVIGLLRSPVPPSCEKV